ncbi:immunoglobulin domain-containing protein, partial [Ancylomarina sp. YFZ004]
MNFLFRSMKIEACIKIAILSFLFLLPFAAKAQLDIIHYVPPMYAGTTSDGDIKDHWVVLTTPSEAPIDVTIKNSDETFSTIIEGISITNPVSFNLGSGTIKNPPFGVINYKRLNQVISDQGLIFTSKQPFYVNIRHKSDIHGLSLTSKGQAALGTSFRSGHLYSKRGSNTDSGWGDEKRYWDRYKRKYIYYNDYSVVNHRSHFISVMATKNTTSVTFSDIKVGNLTSATKTAMPVNGDITVILQAGQSYVIGADHKFLSPDDVNKFNGTKITSDKPIAVNSGSWTGGACLYSAQDIGVDQIVPEDLVGRQYILLKGKGNDETERPIVVATEDDTNITVNGISGVINPEPLNAGDSYVIDAEYFTSEGTMFIETNHDVYLYQTTSASNKIVYDRYGNKIDYAFATVGMNFIPPLSALGFRQVDIPFVNELGTGIVVIYAQKGAAVNVNGNTLPSESAKKVSGNNEWVVYKYSTTENNVSVISNKAIYVALSVEDDAVGAAGYFSGFTKSISPINPEVVFNYDLGYICSNQEGNITLEVNSTPIPDWYEWYHDIIHPDSIKFPNEPLVIPVPEEATKYILKAYFRDPNMDILSNGDFNFGIFNSVSDLDFTDIRLDKPGTAAISYNPQVQNTSFEKFGSSELLNKEPESTKLMLLAHSSGNGASDVIWQIPAGNNIDITDRLFILKLYGRLAHEIDVDYSEQYIDVYVNDDKITPQKIKFDKTDAWKSVKVFWRAGTAESATIKIVDANATGKQSVFAIDSISFVPAVDAEKVFNPDVVPSYSYTPYNKGLHLCQGATQGVADIKYGDMGWFTFLWEKKLPDDTYVAITDTSIEGIDTYKLIFNNVVDSHAGIYRCTINFREDYAQCGIDVKPTHVEVEIFVDETASLDALVGKTELCEGVSTDITATVSGDFSVIKWEVFRKDEATALEVKENSFNTFVFNSDLDYSAGDYTVRCEVVNGCKQNLIKEISIEILGKAKLKSLTVPLDLCDKTAALLVANLEDGPILSAATIKYSWFRNDESVPFLVNDELTCNVIPDVNDEYYKVAVTTTYNVSSGVLTCKGNEIQESLVDNPIHPEIKIIDIKPVSVCEGTAYTYNVKLETPSLSYIYMWEVPIGAQKDKVVPDDFNSSSFSINPVDIDKLGNYKVTVTNNCGSKSSTSTLSMIPKLKDVVISIDNEGPYCPDESVEISITDNGEATLYSAKNLTTLKEIIPMLSPLTLPVVTNEGEWEISVEGECNALVTNRFSVDILGKFSEPTLKNSTVCIGQDASFEVQIATKPSGSKLTYTWTDPNGTPVVIADPNPKHILTVSSVQAENLGIYTCVVANKCGYSKTVTATLSAESVTSSLKETDVICQGSSDYLLKVDYVGTPTFAWRFVNSSGVETILGTNPSYTISKVELADAGIYYCAIKLKCGTVNYQRKLVVNDHISVTEDPAVVLDICEGDKTELIINVTGNPVSIKWFDHTDTELTAYKGETRISTGIITTAGTYNYRYELVGDCEPLDGDFDVVVHDKPSLNAIADINRCAGSDILLSMIVIGTDYKAPTWLNPDNSLLANDLNATITGAIYPTSSGNYIAKISSKYCGEVTRLAKVNIYKPIAVFSNSDIAPKPCVGEPLSLVVTGDGDILSYKWTKGGIDQGPQPIPNILDLDVADLGDNGNYKCELISTNACTSAFVNFTVVVRKHAQITLQPIAQNPCEDNTSVIFKVTGTAELTPSYQWFNNNVLVNNGVDFTGAETKDLTVSNLLAYDDDLFHCKVSGEFCDPIESEKVSLTVKRNVTISTHPADRTVDENASAVFTVVATGDEPLTYQWFEDDGTGFVSMGNSPASAETSSLTIASASLSMNGYRYYCKVTNSCNFKDSNPATLRINLDNRITAQAENTESCEGSSFNFVIQYDNTTTACVWQYNDGSGYQAIGGLGSDVFSETSSILTITPATSAMNLWKFRALVQRTGFVDNESNEFEVKVYQKVLFADISDETLCIGAGKSFNVNVTAGTEPLSYEWKRGTTGLGTGSSLNLDAAALAGTYSI